MVSLCFEQISKKPPIRFMRTHILCKPTRESSWTELGQSLFRYLVFLKLVRAHPARLFSKAVAIGYQRVVNANTSLAISGLSLKRNLQAAWVLASVGNP